MRIPLACFVLGVIAVATTPGAAQEGKTTHVLLKAADLKWEPSAALPKGAMAVVVSGDPGKPVPFALRVKLPAGFKIPPHWHPTDEHVTVLSGTFAVGMGERFDPTTLQDMPAGTYAAMPAEMRHFAMAKTAAIVQVHGIGPFALTYVNPADDPRTAPTATPAK